MDIVVDTSAVIAVITNEPDRPRILAVTQDTALLAPRSLHWEIGNAFSAMFKRRRITLEQARDALALYRQIPIRFTDVELQHAMDLAAQLNIYAYDAYMLVCAQQHRCRLLSIDTGLLHAAQEMGLQVVEIERGEP
ncbi:MAG: type II toxin-antitoxin system VapC family toxin [Candidatus Tectomicrobia bacterium]|nr:type II toxin-antitoxin system VapC family toxin [Candidatus Tectomicrobia bacterium]